jgi:hypothetical protein
MKMGMSFLAVSLVLSLLAGYLVNDLATVCIGWALALGLLGCILVVWHLTD